VRTHDKLDETMLSGVAKAWHEAHEVSAYARAEALSLAYLGFKDQALNVLNLMCQNVRDQDLAPWAHLWLAKLKSGVSQEDILAEMRTAPPAFSRFTEWTYANSSVMENIKQAASAQDLQGIIDMDPDMKDQFMSQSHE